LSPPRLQALGSQDHETKIAGITKIEAFQVDLPLPEGS
jgi:hypothetical protein